VKLSGVNKALLKGLFVTTNHEDDKDGSGDHEKEHTS
jgi:hypothetical protein